MSIIKVKTGGITADAITDALIADDVVGTEHLTANEVDTTALGADAVTGAQLADNAVNSEHYTDGSVDTAHIADAQITTAKLSTAVLTGATDIGADIADADLFLVDDGAGGTLRKTAASRLKTYVGGGITEADMHRLTAEFSGNVNGISSNWERVDDASFAKIGTGITNNSGTWSFGATGLYQLIWHTSFNKNADIRYVYNHLNVTVNNSSYVEIAIGWGNLLGNTLGGTAYHSVEASTFINVDNVSNVKFKLGVNSLGGAATTMGATANSYTWVQTIRLGDAQ